MKNKSYEIIKDFSLQKISNIKLYCSFIIFSIILIIISHILHHEILNIFENISYSILAATFMACFIDYNNFKRSEQEKEDFRERYLSEVNHLLSLIIGHLLWLEENLDNEKINWDLDSKNFLININNSPNPEESEEISFNEAIINLEKMDEKYSTMNHDKIPKREMDKINKIFQIFSFELELLIGKMNKINDDKIFLEIMGYVSLNDINNILENFYFCCIMFRKETHYSNAIKLFISTVKSIRILGKCDSDVKISINEPIFNILDLI